MVNPSTDALPSPPAQLSGGVALRNGDFHLALARQQRHPFAGLSLAIATHPADHGGRSQHDTR